MYLIRLTRYPWVAEARQEFTQLRVNQIDFFYIKHLFDHDVEIEGGADQHHVPQQHECREPTEQQSHERRQCLQRSGKLCFLCLILSKRLRETRVGGQREPGAGFKQPLRRICHAYYTVIVQEQTL